MALKNAALGQADGFLGREQSSHLASIRSMISSACDRVSREVAIRSAVRELEQLDDRALQDIGINRFDIETFARHGRNRV
jgi:uncharacterized protein YjiS (DUF1127 family)